MNVRIVSDKIGTRVLTESGAVVEGISGLTFRAEVGDVNRVQIDLAAGHIDAGAEAAFHVGGREIRRIEYADGTIDEFPAS